MPRPRRAATPAGVFVGAASPAGDFALPFTHAVICSGPCFRWSVRWPGRFGRRFRVAPVGGQSNGSGLWVDTLHVHLLVHRFAALGVSWIDPVSAMGITRQPWDRVIAEDVRLRPVSTPSFPVFTVVFHWARLLRPTSTLATSWALWLPLLNRR